MNEHKQFVCKLLVSFEIYYTIFHVSTFYIGVGTCTLQKKLNLNMHAYLFCIRMIEISVRIINVCGIILSRPPEDVNVDKEISYQNTALYIRPNIFDMRM